MVPHWGRAREPGDDYRPTPPRAVDGGERLSPACPWPHVLRPVARGAGRARRRRHGVLHRLAWRSRRATDGPGTEAVAVLAAWPRAASCARPGVALAPGPGTLQRAGEPAPCRRHERGRREVLLDERVRRGGSHHQKLFVIRHRGDAGQRRRLRRRHRPLPRPPRRRAAPRRPAGDRRSTRATADARRGTTSSSRCAARRSATSSTRSASAGTIRRPLAPAVDVDRL